jgi:hypothetical protein
LQKLSGLITETDNGSYALTDAGRRALDIFRESERSGRSPQDLCCLPARSEMAEYKQVGRKGSILRLALGSGLLAITGGILFVYFATGEMALTFHFNGSVVSIGMTIAIIFGFFGVSFLISGMTAYPGCEVTAIPNLFSRNNRYCSCLITPYNLPDGSLLLFFLHSKMPNLPQ